VLCVQGQWMPAPARCPGAYLWATCFHLGDGNQSGESLMQELAKTASRVDALDTQTVPNIGFVNPIPNRCMLSNVNFFWKNLFSFTLSPCIPWKSAYLTCQEAGPTMKN
jgi:hypothetical protein